MGQNGIAGTGSAAALSWQNYGVSAGSDPSYGAIAVMSRGGGLGHVGFVAGVDLNGNVVLLGGNQADAVSLRGYSSANMNFRLPAGYDIVPAPVILDPLPHGGGLR
jgi:uncharacterized protein (TIGR02594 family)